MEELNEVELENIDGGSLKSYTINVIGNFATYGGIGIAICEPVCVVCGAHYGDVAYGVEYLLDNKYYF